MDIDPDVPTRAEPKSRGSIVYGGLALCAILLPLMVYYRQQTQLYGDIEITSGAELDPRVRLYSAPQISWSDEEKNAYKRISAKLLAKCDNIEKQVDVAERQRCIDDPHLAAAIEDPYKTPFVGPNPKLQASFKAQSLMLVDLLIADYQANSLDNAELQSKLIPLMRKTLEAIRQDGRREGYEELILLDTETPDPLFCYCLIVASQRPVLTQIVERTKSSTSIRVTHPYLRYLISLSNKDKNGDVSFDQMIMMVDALVDLVSRHQDNKALISTVLSDVHSTTKQTRAAVLLDMVIRLDALEAPKCPEWILHYLFSRLNQITANSFRGTSYMSDVSENNLKVFEEHMEIQAKHLLRAWVLAPNQIELYEDLIWAEGRAGVTGRSKEVWLRHALATRIDCDITIDQYCHLLMPRWGGTESQMFWLADKCSEAIGVDADLPFYFWYPLQVWCVDNGYQANLGHPSPLRSTLRIVDYLKKQPEDFRHPMICNERGRMIVRVLWDAGQLTELNWLMQKYGSALGPWRMIVHQLDQALIEQVCHAASQKDAADCWSVIHSELLLDSRTLGSEGLERVQLALDEAEIYATDDQSKAAVRNCRKIHGWAKSYYEGDETVLDFDDHMSGWMVAARSQLIDRESADGTAPGVELTVYASTQTCVLRPLIRFQPPYSVEATIQTRSLHTDDIYGLALQAGAPAFYSSNCKGVEVRLNPYRRKFAFDHIPIEQKGYGLKFAMIPDIKKAYRLRLDLQTDKATAFIDDKEIGAYDSVLETHGLVQFGREIAEFFTSPATSKDIVSFALSNVKITRLPLQRDLPISSVDYPSKNSLDDNSDSIVMRKHKDAH